MLVDAAALGEYALPARRRLLLLETSPLATRQLNHRVVLGWEVLRPSSCWDIVRVNAWLTLLYNEQGAYIWGCAASLACRLHS